MPYLLYSNKSDTLDRISIDDLKCSKSDNSSSLTVFTQWKHTLPESCRDPVIRLVYLLIASYGECSVEQLCKVIINSYFQCQTNNISISYPFLIVQPNGNVSGSPVVMYFEEIIIMSCCPCFASCILHLSLLFQPEPKKTSLVLKPKHP